MFSFSINNPNNFIILNDNTNNYNVIPFGHRCSSALASKYANIRNFSLPFDWGIPFYPNIIKNILANDFDGFTEFTYSDNNSYVSNQKYDFGSYHYNSDHNINVETFNRRIDRFNDIIIQSKKIYFIYINEDYLYDNNYRNEFNQNIFIDMLELEKFIKEKYINIDYNILYFDFKHHNIPKNSNIINIVINSTNLYEIHDDSPYEEFRNYCGKILSELFNTDLSINCDCETFNK
jgi:hypothetical protein